MELYKQAEHDSRRTEQQNARREETMNQSVMETLNKGIALIEQEISEREARHSSRESATDAALGAAFTDRSAQQRGIIERIAALESEAAAKESECSRIAGLMSTAYGRKDNAAAIKLEKQLDEAEREKGLLLSKIARMKENVPQIIIADNLVQAARESLEQLLQASRTLFNDFNRTGEQIGEIIKKLEQLKESAERKAAILFRAPDRNERKEKLISIIENNEGEIVVSGHHCGSDKEAKFRYSLHGRGAAGLEDIPLFTDRASVTA